MTTKEEKSSKTSLTMRRRQHHQRSKKGCDTCKERHIRCDERLPFCRNCLRVGRECVYAARKTPDPTKSDTDEEILPPATQQACAAKNLPQEHAVSYHEPHQQGISSAAISVVQQSYQISSRRPMPKSILLTISEDFLPRYNHLAGLHECVKYAFVAFGAYIHHEATKSAESREICISHNCVALEKLQHEINNFSALNADAIVTASIVLAGAADDWDQWMVYIEGYSRALSYIRDHKLQTLYPELLGENFQQRNYASSADKTIPPLPRNRPLMQRRVQEIIGSVKNTSKLIGSTASKAVGFDDLEQLALTVDSAIFLSSDTEIYHRLAWLRSWMFWIELRRMNSGDEQLALTCHFYALVAAIVPIYPARYSISLPKICIARMEAMIPGMTEESAWKWGLYELLSSAQESW